MLNISARIRAALAALGLAMLAMPCAQAQEITVWSHWAAEAVKRGYVEEAAKRFEASRPGVKVKITWYEKTALYAALRTALRAGQAPDVFYAEPDQTDYIDNGFLADLSSGLNWGNIEPWAKTAWTVGRGTYGFPLEASTVELYYNRKLLEELGVKLPPNGQLEQGAFLDLVKKAKARGITPMSQGVGDRPFPGAYVTHEVLLKKLGTKEYDDLLRGKLSWNDKRVVEALQFVKQLVDAGAFPASFTSLKLGESHTYFHTNPGALMFQMGSWYTSRAFNPTDKGGQPAGFPLGIMQMPAMTGGACNQCKTMAVGGSFVVNAASPRKEVAIALLNSMATPEMGNKWLENVLVQTGIKTDASKVSGPHADYFKQLARANEGNTYYFGMPIQVMQGKPKEVFTQVINNAFPAGSIGIDDVVKQMNAAK
ncbi:MAG: extracellular solute-binding protein [Betaproteobacteria bacterium]